MYLRNQSYPQFKILIYFDYQNREENQKRKEENYIHI